MDLIKYYRLDPDTLANELKDSLNLDIEKGREVEDFFRSKGYYVVCKPEKKRVSLWVRLTAPLYFMYIFILILLMPVKWIVNGELYYKYDGGMLVKLAKKWRDALAF